MNGRHLLFNTSFSRRTSQWTVPLGIIFSPNYCVWQSGYWLPCTDNLESTETHYASLLCIIFLILIFVQVGPLGSQTVLWGAIWLSHATARPILGVKSCSWGRSPLAARWWRSHRQGANFEISGSHRQAVVIFPCFCFIFKTLLSTSWNMGCEYRRE